MQFTNPRGIAVCLLIGFSALSPRAFSQVPRTWQDNSGKFSVQAVLISQTPNTVRLKTAAGQVINVPKARLSQSDIDYLESSGKSAKKRSASDAERALDTSLAGPPIQRQSEETLASFLKRVGSPVFIDRRGLNQAGIPADVPVNSDVAAASLSEQLDTVLAEKQLAWYRLRTALVVTSIKKAARDSIEVFAYRIPIPRNDFSAVSQKLQSVEPSSWEAMGGRGSVVPLPNFVVIRQTGEIHRKLAQQLQLRPIPHRFVHPLDNAVVAIELDNGTLDEFAEQLQSQINRKVRLSESLSTDLAITADLDQVSAADALNLVLGQIDCQWLERPNELEFVPADYAQEQLEQRRVNVPFASTPMASLVVNAIMTLVEPSSWKPLGGPGQIQPIGGKIFQVSQSQPTFRELNQLLADLGGAG
ncbi:hypothetical protein FYK55_17235 [Roseiconus nitratireducens]|uniref:SLA1 homology domain-containing protein n=1 Tax=Roseiconus nitratireducens TaxID=2605748 RepID=A0A5M6D402_9BACT|nr:SHD1 domain-containing protein [Roseiconus nitratireducens]KAA5541320.1 hypothetical protein FYK55_17235 [Roseiconus nitratireducens]